MNDEQIREMFFINNKINGNLLSAKIKKGNDPVIEYLENRFDDSDSVKESLYRIIYGIKKKPLCPVCGGPVKLSLHGYKKHCSVKCAHANPETIEKSVKTCREHFGVDFSMQNEKVQEKSRKTNKKKYGVEYPAQNREIMDKVNATNFERYGMKRATKTEKTQEKYRESCRKKYGTDYALQSNEVKQKGRETVMQKYGVNHITKAEEVKEKIVNTNIRKYGVKYVFQSEQIKEKIKKTIQKKYGVDNPSQAKEIQDKKIKTTIHNFGVPFLLQSPEQVERCFMTRKRNNTVNTSKFEEAAYEQLSMEFPDVIRQYKSESYPYHCDFYVPSLDLYIELNYSWTHGKHPFDPESVKDIIELEKLKEKAKVSDYYANAVNIWTARDPEKLAAAKKASLNYMAVYRGFDIARLIEAIRENFTMGRRETTVILT